MAFSIKFSINRYQIIRGKFGAFIFFYGIFKRIV